MSDHEAGEKRKRVVEKVDAKYKCPGCMARTCSAACSKEHKQETGCSGQRDRTKFVKRAEYDANTLMSDYGFLQELSRDHDNLTRLVKEQGVPTGNASKGRKPMQQAGLALLPSLLTQKNTVTRARVNRNVSIRYMSPGIQRHAQNKTLWSKSHSRLVWTIEVSVPELEGVADKWIETGFHDVCQLGDLWERLLLFNSSDSKKPVDTVTSSAADTRPPPRKRAKQDFIKISLPSDDGSEHIFKSNIPRPTLDAIKAKFATSAVTELTWLIKAQDTPANKPTFYRIDPCQPLHTQLVYQTVVEFPTFFVYSAPPTRLGNHEITILDIPVAVQASDSESSASSSSESSSPSDSEDSDDENKTKEK
ncbi:hypothetical protein DL89DRAFT_264364 [Linderina pennispora]|uniref:HIT-type domain-containing protein n=1 Tax=Linderina pennispora TaxID=61395 RepID=A0A1Y1WN11_9FUNG|nr:uncharacterized protein DL89DRAFT_264364 [Linderina pennispora]ORX74504.1 hypothetical protein DL89DRAFT_264364 [Linderina pennispora]